MTDGDANSEKMEELKARVKTLEKENQRLSILLETITEHADSFESELVKTQENLTYYDPLTELPNRLMFQDRFNQAVQFAEQKQQPVALVLIDLDHFKNINEAFGHMTGDNLLCSVSERLRKQLDNDIDILARFGDDEFAVLVSNFGDVSHRKATQHIAQIAEKILSVFQLPFTLQAQEIFTTCSIGISLSPQDGKDIEELAKNAGAAMNEAKLQGRNNYQFFSTTMNTEAERRMSLKNDLQYVVERNELELYYQPQIDTYRTQLIGVEALVRWHHPVFGLVSPSEFIPLAEENGLITQIGEWVLRTACQQTMDWQKEGIQPLRMAINLSVRQFYDENFISSIENTLNETGIMPSCLELEITESVAMNNVKKSQQMMSALKDLRIDLAIDDFGTGYSSLNYLNKFTLDVLKIDAAFIADIQSPKGATLIRAIVNMAHSLGMKIVAEGVETPEQLAFLRSCQCDIVQGYLFSQPITADKIARLFKIYETTHPIPSLDSSH